MLSARKELSGRGKDKEEIIMAGGRPTKYSKEILEKAEEYLAVCKDVILDDGKLLKVNFPSMGGLALFLDVHRDTIYEWRSKHPEFSYILDKILVEQERRLIENGLSGHYNSNIAKLVLGKHGYKEQSDLTSGGEKIEFGWQK